jgi:hypothetical protein
MDTPKGQNRFLGPLVSIALAMVATTSCGVDSENFNQRYARVICSRIWDCHEATAEWAFDSKDECRELYEESFGSEFTQEEYEDCYDWDYADECLNELRHMDCDDLRQKRFGTACRDFMRDWDCYYDTGG